MKYASYCPFLPPPFAQDMFWESTQSVHPAVVEDEGGGVPGWRNGSGDQEDSYIQGCWEK